MDTDAVLVQMLEKMINQGTSDINAYIGLAQLYIQSEQPQKAKDLLSQALSLNSNNPQLYDLLAVASLQLGLNLLAEIEIRKAISISPNPFFLRRLGYILCMEDRYREAYDVFSQLYTISPSDEIRQELEDLNKKLEKAEIQAFCVRKALELNPNFSDAWANLAYTLVMMGKYEDALAAFRRALELNPTPTIHYHNIGRVYAILGKYPESTKCFNSLCKADPTNPEAFRYLGQLREILGDHKGAKDAYQCAQQLDGQG
ncbi:MAG: tetratricopeptide repeat protein [Candidatus Methanomethylicaceae archaeon]